MVAGLVDLPAGVASTTDSDLITCLLAADDDLPLEQAARRCCRC